MLEFCDHSFCSTNNSIFFSMLTTASECGLYNKDIVFSFNGRQGAAGSKGQRGTRESRAIPAPDANAELVLSMQVL